MEQPKKVKIWVKLFVLFHLVAISVWALPNQPPAILSGRAEPGGTDWIPYWNQKYLKPFPLFRIYDKTLGFWQYWDMFSPDPNNTDRWADADIVYRNGTIKHYAYPRMVDLSTGAKFIKERFRKFLERTSNDQFVYLWPNFALRIALLNDDPANPPVEVRLYRHLRLTVPPGQPQPAAYSKELYFTYTVDLKELAKLRKGE